MQVQNCPNCGANLDKESISKGTCLYCGTTLPKSLITASQSDDANKQAAKNATKSKSNRLFVFLWVFACFAIGVNMLKNDAPGLIGFIPFIMGVVGAVEMLRRNPNRNGRQSSYPKNSGDNR